MIDGGDQNLLDLAFRQGARVAEDLFGAKYNATNYGVVLLGFGAGAIASFYIAGSGYFKSIAAEDISLMFPAFIILTIAAAVGIVLILILRKSKES